MKKFVTSLLLVFSVLAAGCGDTTREELSRNYRRMTLPAPGKDLRPVCRAVMDSFYGSSRPGKTEFMFVAGPISFTDKNSGRVGRETCSMAILSQPDYQEVFVQIRREVPDSKLLGMNSQAGYDRDSHIPATPMEAGLTMPASRQIPWRYVGRDYEKENIILDQIKNAVTSADTAQ